MELQQRWGWMLCIWFNKMDMWCVPMVFGKHVSSVGAISLALLHNKHNNTLALQMNNIFNIPNKTSNNKKCHLLFYVDYIL
jgi:hypothetical protein